MMVVKIVYDSVVRFYILRMVEWLLITANWAHTPPVFSFSCAYSYWFVLTPALGALHGFTFLTLNQMALEVTLTSYGL